MLDAHLPTIIGGLYVHLKYSVKVAFRRRFQASNVCNAGIVHKNVNAVQLEQLAEDALYAIETRHIAFVSDSVPTSRADFLHYGFGPLPVNIEDAHARATPGNGQSHRPPNSASAAGNDNSLAVEPKTSRIAVVRGQSDTPLFQGIKSS